MFIQCLRYSCDRQYLKTSVIIPHNYVGNSILSYIRPVVSCHFGQSMKFVIIYTGGAGIAYPSGATEFITCFSGIRVALYLVLCVCFVDRCLSCCPFSFNHCVVCPSMIYESWLPPLVSSNSYYRQCPYLQAWVLYHTCEWSITFCRIYKQGALLWQHYWMVRKTCYYNIYRTFVNFGGRVF